MIQLTSKLDRSVNFVLPTRHQFEARYVQRDESSKIFYVSSQSGCSQGCRFCHLTATKQTAGVNATIDDYIRQLEPLIEHSKTIGTERLPTHVNFMARGEPLVNPQFLDNPDAVLSAISERIRGRIKFKISTILPRGIDLRTLQWGDAHRVDLYVSYYSASQAFRHKWMPKAATPSSVRQAIRDWEGLAIGSVYLHRALIQGENDGLSTAHEWCESVKGAGRPRVNLIAYNPPPGDSHLPASDKRIERIASITKSYFPAQVQVVARVGHDVNASCGMFVKQP